MVSAFPPFDVLDPSAPDMVRALFDFTAFNEMIFLDESELVFLVEVGGVAISSGGSGGGVGVASFTGVDGATDMLASVS